MVYILSFFTDVYSDMCPLWFKVMANVFIFYKTGRSACLILCAPFVFM